MRHSKRETSVSGTRPYTAATNIHKLGHITEERLDHIVRQVDMEDYHVERFSVFHDSGRSILETVSAITDWAASVHLKVAFNHEYDICVFERS